MSPQRSISRTRKARDRDPPEARRARGEISCAECRRLKLKCDKSIPCSSCMRRGCQTICPNGILSSVQGSRVLLADTENLHHKLAEMGKRIRQLEDALQLTHAAVSEASHPLLSEDLLQIKNGVVKPPPSHDDDDDKEVRNKDLDREILTSFESLAISGHREAESYLTCSDTQFDCPEPFERKVLADESSWPTILPLQVTHLSKTFPFAPLFLPADDIQNVIEQMLPSYERASALAETYLENLSWFFRPVDREQIIEELIPIVYKKRRVPSASANLGAASNVNNIAVAGSTGSNESSAAEPPRTDPHTLALLLAVFAVGAAADLTLPPCNDEAELYVHLSRAAVSLKSVFDNTSLQTLQAVSLIGAYDLFSCGKSSLEGTWKIISFAMSLASNVGLFRDPSHWKLSPKVIQRQRRVFWELYALDAWKAFCSGKPTTFSPSIVDCKLPHDVDAIIDEDVWRWRQRFVKEVVTEVIHRFGMAQSLKYSEILALDQKIRDFGPQQLFNRTVGALHASSSSGGVEIMMGRHMLNMLKDSTLLILHRNFFARAILDDPTSPMWSAFGPSFLSAYRSATCMLRGVREQYDAMEHLMLRMWPVWANAFTASVILGSVAALGKSSALAGQAFTDFDLTIGLFAKAQMHPVVKDGLPILLRLRDKARLAISEQCDEIIANPDYRPQTELLMSGSSGRKEKEFSVLGGMGHLLRKSLRGEFGYSPKMPLETLGNLLCSPSTPEPTDASLQGAPAAPPIFSPLFDSPSAYASGSGAGAVPHVHDVSTDMDTRGCENDAAQTSTSTTSGVETGMETMPSAAGPIGPTRQLLQDQSGPIPDKDVLEDLFDFNVQDGEFSAFMMDVNINHPMDLSLGTASEGIYGGLAVGMDRFSSYTGGSSNSNLTDAGDTSIPSGLGSNSGPSHTNPHEDARMQGLEHTEPPDGLSALEGLSALSPSTVFNTDFEVSYDMRAATGEGSLLPLIPQDMEAWRAILQDSRFISGTTNEESRMAFGSMYTAL